VRAVDVDHDQVGLLARLQRADLVLKAHDAGGADRMQLQRLRAGEGGRTPQAQPHGVEGVAHALERVVQHPVGGEAGRNAARHDVFERRVAAAARIDRRAMGIGGAALLDRVEIARAGEDEMGEHDIRAEHADIPEELDRATAMGFLDLLDLGNALRGMNMHADAEPVRLGAGRPQQLGRTGVGGVGADARGDAAIGSAVPAFGEGDAVAQALLADLRMVRVVAAPELVQADIEDLVGDLGPQAAGLDRFGEPVRRIPDVVDGGDAGLEHVGAAGLGQQRPLILRDVLLHPEGDFEQRRLGGVVVGLAAEDQRGRM
jgi:hypothetical protein